jgi:glycosyltransferase involved in cell wall biosynthesis
MKAYKLISLIIPSYNRADFIAIAVKSALAQTYPNFEIIVVDDGSTDNTEEVVAALKHPKLFYYKKANEERAAARNFGIKKAKGDYITFLDSDDFLLPHHFQSAIAFIEKNEEPPLFYQLNNFVDETGKVLSQTGPIKGSLNIQLIVDGNFLSCIGVFIKSDIAKAFPFNEDRALSGTEDHELWCRLAARYEIGYNNVVTSSMVQHDNRSVMHVDEEKLITRLLLFIKYVSADEAFIKKYKWLMPAMKAQALSYLSLHFAITHKHFKPAFLYLRKALAIYPAFISQRRFYAILKHLAKSI